MKVTLNIENDKELRSHIKDAIKGQISTIVRDEYYAIVKEQIDKKVRSQSGYNLEYYLKEALSREVKNLIKSTDITKSVDKEFAKLHVEAALKAAADNATTIEGWIFNYVDKSSILSAYSLDNIK